MSSARGENFVLVQYPTPEKTHKFKMMLKGDVAALPISKIKRYLKNATGVEPEDQVLKLKGNVLPDGAIGQDVGMTAGDQLVLSVRSKVDPQTTVDATLPDSTHENMVRGKSSGVVDPDDASVPSPRAARSSKSVAAPRSVVSDSREPSTSRPGTSSPRRGNAAALPQSVNPGVVTHSAARKSVSPGANAGVTHAHNSALTSHRSPQAENTTLKRKLEELQRKLEEANAQIENIQEKKSGTDGLRGKPLAEACLMHYSEHNDIHPPLAWDGNNMACIRSSKDKEDTLEGEIELFATYDIVTERIYIYTPLRIHFPTTSRARLDLYEMLLEGSLLGRELAGGSVGISLRNQSVLLSTSVDMLHSEPSALTRITPQFVDAVQKWKQRFEPGSAFGDAPCV